MQFIKFTLKISTFLCVLKELPHLIRHLIINYGQVIGSGP